MSSSLSSTALETQTTSFSANNPRFSPAFLVGSHGSTALPLETSGADTLAMSGDPAQLRFGTSPMNMLGATPFQLGSVAGSVRLGTSVASKHPSLLVSPPIGPILGGSSVPSLVQRSDPLRIRFSSGPTGGSERGGGDLDAPVVGTTPPFLPQPGGVGRPRHGSPAPAEMSISGGRSLSPGSLSFGSTLGSLSSQGISIGSPSPHDHHRHVQPSSLPSAAHDSASIAMHTSLSQRHTPRCPPIGFPVAVDVGVGMNSLEIVVVGEGGRAFVLQGDVVSLLDEHPQEESPPRVTRETSVLDEAEGDHHHPHRHHPHSHSLHHHSHPSASSHRRRPPPILCDGYESGKKNERERPSPAVASLPHQQQQQQQCEERSEDVDGSPHRRRRHRRHPPRHQDPMRDPTSNRMVEKKEEAAAAVGGRAGEAAVAVDGEESAMLDEEGVTTHPLHRVDGVLPTARTNSARTMTTRTVTRDDGFRPHHNRKKKEKKKKKKKTSRGATSKQKTRNSASEEVEPTRRGHGRNLQHRGGDGGGAVEDPFSEKKKTTPTEKKKRKSKSKQKSVRGELDSEAAKGASAPSCAPVEDVLSPAERSHAQALLPSGTAALASGVTGPHTRDGIYSEIILQSTCWLSSPTARLGAGATGGSSWYHPADPMSASRGPLSCTTPVGAGPSMTSRRRGSPMVPPTGRLSGMHPGASTTTTTTSFNAPPISFTMGMEASYTGTENIAGGGVAGSSSAAADLNVGPNLTAATMTTTTTATAAAAPPPPPPPPPPSALRGRLSTGLYVNTTMTNTVTMAGASVTNRGATSHVTAPGYTSRFNLSTASPLSGAVTPGGMSLMGRSRTTLGLGGLGAGRDKVLSAAGIGMESMASVGISAAHSTTAPRNQTVPIGKLCLSCVWNGDLFVPLVPRARVLPVQANAFCSIVMTTNGSAYVIDSGSCTAMECAVTPDCCSFTVASSTTLQEMDEESLLYHLQDSCGGEMGPQSTRSAQSTRSPTSPFPFPRVGGGSLSSPTRPAPPPSLLQPGETIKSILCSCVSVDAITLYSLGSVQETIPSDPGARIDVGSHSFTAADGKKKPVLPTTAPLPPYPQGKSLWTGDATATPRTTAVVAATSPTGDTVAEINSAHSSSSRSKSRGAGDRLSVQQSHSSSSFHRPLPVGYTTTLTATGTSSSSTIPITTTATATAPTRSPPPHLPSSAAGNTSASPGMVRRSAKMEIPQHSIPVPLVKPSMSNVFASFSLGGTTAPERSASRGYFGGSMGVGMSDHVFPPAGEDTRYDDTLEEEMGYDAEDWARAEGSRDSSSFGMDDAEADEDAEVCFFHQWQEQRLLLRLGNELLRLAQEEEQQQTEVNKKDEEEEEKEEVPKSEKETRQALESAADDAMRKGEKRKRGRRQGGGPLCTLWRDALALPERSRVYLKEEEDEEDEDISSFLSAITVEERIFVARKVVTEGYSAEEWRLLRLLASEEM